MKKEMTIEDLAHVNIPVKLNGVKHTIIGLKMVGTNFIQEALGMYCGIWFIEIINENTHKTDILRPFIEWTKVDGVNVPLIERYEAYKTCVRAANKWIKKELRK